MSAAATSESSILRENITTLTAAEDRKFPNLALLAQGISARNRRDASSDLPILKKAKTSSRGSSGCPVAFIDLPDEAT
jgi:hypothetical protein